MARPKSPEPKRNRLELRLTDEELKDIDYIAECLHLSRSAAILEAVQSRADEIYRVREARYAENQEKAD